MRVFGELPNFDFESYTFLACYAPHVDGDGMEHRNSTILTSVRPLSEGGQEGNIGTVAHEFFHAWNVERIRPASLEPFDFEDSNISGELWFAEGFTSYYTNLTLCRTGIISEEDYANRLASVLSYVVNSPGRKLAGPVGMSQQAPFVDAATSVDEVNRENTFISYYSYGNVLGLALDLLLLVPLPVVAAMLAFAGLHLIVPKPLTHASWTCRGIIATTAFIAIAIDMVAGLAVGLIIELIRSQFLATRHPSI